MKFDWKKLKRSALQSLGRLAVRMRASQRRFRHAGGFPGLFRRTGQNLRRREPRTLAACACTALVLVAVPVLCLASLGKRAAAAGLEDGRTADLNLLQAESTAPASGYIDLASAFTPAPTPTPRPSARRPGRSGLLCG